MITKNHWGDRVNYIVQSANCWFRCTWKPEITEYDVAMWKVKWKMDAALSFPQDIEDAFHHQKTINHE